MFASISKLINLLQPKRDATLDLFYALHIKAKEEATWALAKTENLYYADAGILLEYRNSPNWSPSRDRRMLGFLRRYKGRYIPSFNDLRNAELFTQEHGITIEAADILVQLKNRKHSRNAQAELIVDDKQGKLKDRDYYLVV